MTEAVTAATALLAQHVALARATFPGWAYDAWLAWFHDLLQPELYVEIGVDKGKTFALALPGSYAVGVDPSYALQWPLRAWSRLYRLTSNTFFAAGHAVEAFQGRRPGLGFIDGLHHFDQVVQDFVSLEHCVRPEAVILLHDVVPICADVAQRDQTTAFWTGDVFKALLVLAEVRPDLGLGLLPCYPSGLGIVTRLQPDNDLDLSAYQAVIANAMRLDYPSALARLHRVTTPLPNDRAAVLTYLRGQISPLPAASGAILSGSHPF